MNGTAAVDWRLEWRPLAGLLALFGALLVVPLDDPRVGEAVGEGLLLTREYARSHVLLCLVPAFFIAGAIGVFLSQEAVMRFLGPGAKKLPAYGVAAVSGTVLAVCSCTVLPLFSGIHQMGAGLGPASAFLYSGPAINVLAVVLTARVLGWQLGLARAIGAVVFALLVGLAMHWIFRREEGERRRAAAALPVTEGGRPLWQSALFLGSLVAILVFANWGRPEAGGGNLVAALGPQVASDRRGRARPGAGAGALVRPGVVEGARRRRTGRPAGPPRAGRARARLRRRRRRPDGGAGALCERVGRIGRGVRAGRVAGVELGVRQADLAAPLRRGVRRRDAARPPRPRRAGAVRLGGLGGRWRGARRTAFAAVAGALMYFATLTEVPILQGLLGSGMGQGPALALLLAGPALSLPNMLVIARVLGWTKTLTYVGLGGDAVDRRRVRLRKLDSLGSNQGPHRDQSPTLAEPPFSRSDQHGSSTGSPPNPSIPFPPSGGKGTPPPGVLSAGGLTRRCVVKRIEILGTGCPKCQRLSAATEDAARSLGIDYELVKVTEIQEIVARGVMMTPGLVVDGEVKATGRIPAPAELASLLA